MSSSDTEDNFGVNDGTSVKLRPRVCIVCGIVSQVVYGPDGKIIRVKEEIDAEEIDVDGVSSKSFQELGENGKPEKNLEWEISLYETFVKALKLNLKSAKYQWNFPEEPVPFCDSCEDRISTLRDIFIQLEELEKLVACTVNELKEKMTVAEEKFQRDNVYKHDERYYWVRSGVIGKKNVGYFPTIKIKSPKALKKALPSSLTREPLRRSCRQSSQIMLLSSQWENENSTDNLQEESHPVKVEVEEGASPHFVADTDSFSVEKPTLRKTRIKPTNKRPAKSKEITNVKKRKKKREEFGRKSLNISPPTLEEGDWEGLDLFDENLQSPQSPESQPLLQKTQKKKIKKKTEEEYKPDSDLSESEDDQNQDDHNQGENKSESEEDVDDPCPESVLSGRLKVKGVRFLQSTGQVAYRDIIFDPVLGSDEGENKSDSKKKFKCTKCDRVVKTQFQVKRHSKKYHLGEFSCPYSGCGYRSGFKCSLTRHVQRFHLSEHARKKLEKSECDICGKPIKRRQHIQSHRLSHYSAAEKKEAEMKGEIPPWILRVLEREPSQCELCGKIFQDAKSVKNHKRYAHTKKPEDEQQSTNKTSPKEMLICQVCGKALSSSSSLRTHIGRQHPNTDEASSLQYICIFCNMRFINQTKLLEHKIIHTGERNFRCSYPDCPRQFITKLQLTKHLKVHSNVRPYQCSKCPSGFMSNHHLQRHFANYHAPGSNPKRKSFIRGPAQTPFRVMNKWKNLYLGESQQTEIRRRKCPICPAAFQYPSQVKRHILSFHSQQELVSGSEETPRSESIQNDNVQQKFARCEEEVSDMEVDWSQSQSSSTIAQDQDIRYASPGSSDHPELMSPVPENLTVRTTFYI